MPQLVATPLYGDTRTALTERIRRDATAQHVLVVGPRRFNELWDEMHARGETLNDLLWWAHRAALEPVLAKARSEPEVLVVLDEFDRTRHASKQFQGILPPAAKVDQRPRAGDSIAVGAASILARAERDRQVALLVEKWGLTLDLAPAAAKAHPQAREFAKVAYLKGGPPA